MLSLARAALHTVRQTADQAASAVSGALPDFVSLGNQGMLDQLAGVGSAGFDPASVLASGPSLDEWPGSSWSGSGSVSLDGDTAGGSVSLGSKQAGDSESVSLAMKAQNGQLSGSAGYSAGNENFSANGSVQVDTGKRAYGVAGGAKGKLGPLGAGVKGGGSVDFDDKGRVEGLGGSAGVELGPVSLGVAGANGGHVSPVTATEDGMYKVSWDRAVGGSAKVGGGRDQGGVDQSAEFGVSGAGALVGERVFASQAEAEAFRARVGSLPPTLRHSAADVAAMSPGERIREEFAIQGAEGFTGTDSAALGVEGKGLVGRSLAVERLADGRVRVGVGHSAQLGGSVGLSAGIGVKGSMGAAEARHLEADFDLAQPGALAAFDTFQLTGKLPDPLPAGVTLGDGRASWTTTDGVEGDYAAGSADRAREERRGWVRKDGETVNFVEGTHTEKEFDGFEAFGWGAASEEVHSARVESSDTDPSKRSLTMKSSYKGQFAKAQLADDLSSDSFAEALAKYGAGGNDEFVIETRLNAEQLVDLRDHFIRCRNNKQKLAEDGEVDQHKGREAMIDRFLAGDDAAMVEYVERTGGAGIEFLRMNANETNCLSIPGSRGFVDMAKTDEINAGIQDLEARAASGELTRDEVMQALMAENTRLTAMHIERSRLPPHQLVTKTIKDGHDNVSRLQALLKDAR